MDVGIVAHDEDSIRQGMIQSYLLGYSLSKVFLQRMPRAAGIELITAMHAARANMSTSLIGDEMEVNVLCGRIEIHISLLSQLAGADPAVPDRLAGVAQPPSTLHQWD
eukprot:5867875-Pleurochrysis_carterae.AAC.1